MSTMDWAVESTSAAGRQPALDGRASIPTATTLERAIVVAVEQPGAVVVSIHGQAHVARRAVSCLVQPEAGDGVLISLAKGEPTYVLAVLEREPTSRTRIVAEGGLEIHAAGGPLSLTAQDDVEVVSGATVSMTSGGIRVNAADGVVSLQRLSFFGDIVSTQVARMKVAAGSLEQVIERLSQKVRRSYREIEESDHLRAERIDYAAKKNMSLRAENTLVTAHQLVKIDADQIHVG